MDGYIDLYPENDYRYYLAHHGIKGQRWGVRRYQNMDGTLTDAGRKHVYGSSKTGVIERAKIRLEGRKNTASEIISNTKNAKGIINKASELVGHGAARTKAANEAFTERRLAAASKSKFGKALHNTASENQTYKAQYHTIKQKQSIGRRALETVVPVTALRMPVKDISGRTSTLGNELLMQLSTAGIGRVALSAAYAASSKSKTKFLKEGLDVGAKANKDDYLRRANSKTKGEVKKELKDAKAAYKEKNKKIQDKVWKEEEKIESKYKPGEKMSEKDVAKEMAADDRANKAWAANKANYNKKKKQIKSQRYGV